MSEDPTTPAIIKPKKQRKPRSGSKFIVLKHSGYKHGVDASPDYVDDGNREIVCGASGLAEARNAIESGCDAGRYSIACIRETIDVKQQMMKTLKKVKA